MSTVRVDLHIAVVRREDRYEFALVDGVDGTELSTLGEGAMPHEIVEWIAEHLRNNADEIASVLGGEFYAEYRAVKTG